MILSRKVFCIFILNNKAKRENQRKINKHFLKLALGFFSPITKPFHIEQDNVISLLHDD